MIAREDWSRWSALLDEALELEGAARLAWLADLQQRDASAAAAIGRLLGHETPRSTVTDRLLTVDGTEGARRDFESVLHTLLTQSEAADAAVAGQSFGPWQLRRKLGSGGMGEVWLAERADALYEGHAAIKLLRASGDATRLTARFSRERQALARLAHPGIARLLDAGVERGQPYLVLEYVQGTPLPTYARQHAPTLSQRVRLALAIGRAVEYAHGRLIVHRDLKPSNVLVTPEGEVKLLDFGIASLIDEEHSEQTSLTGLYGRGLTLDYAAPEQITGEPTGVGADVFSLGVLLFELLTGERPFKPSKPGRTALEYAVLHQPAPRLSQRAKGIPASLDAVLGKALQKSPEDRYPTMAAFVADLERWLEHRPVLATQGSWQRNTALWLRRNRLVAGLSTAVIVSLVAGLSVALWQSRQAQAAATRAELQAARATAVSRFMADLFRAADPERTKGATLTALDVLDAGAERLLKAGGEDAEIRAELGSALGATYASLTRPDKGIPVLQAAVQSAAAAYGAKDIRTARLQLVLALAESQNEQYPEAAARYGEALRVLDAAGEPDDLEKIIARGYWMYSLGKTGHFDDAEAVARDTVERATRVHGTQSWAYADAINSMATVASMQSQWARTRQLLESIEPLLLHPPEGYRQDALNMRMNLTNSYARTGALKEAMQRQPQLVQDLSDLIGKDGNQTLVMRWFLADTYKRLGDFKTCAAEYTDLAEARTRISGPRHPLTVDVVSKVAMCRRLTGEMATSRDYAARATEALNPSDEPPQRTTLRVVSTLAALVADAGDAATLAPMLARMRKVMAALNVQDKDDRIYEAMLGAHFELLRGNPAAALAGYETARREAAVPMQNLHPEAYYGYLLALNGQRDAARAQVAKARAVAAERYAPDFQLFAAFDYVDHLIDGRAADDPALLRPLAAAYPVAVKLPLSPLWFGLM